MNIQLNDVTLGEVLAASILALIFVIVLIAVFSSRASDVVAPGDK